DKVRQVISRKSIRLRILEGRRRFVRRITATRTVWTGMKAAYLGQTVHRNHGSGGIDQRLLENALQFSNVARPVVIFQGPHGGGINPHDLLSHLATVANEKMLDEQPQIAISIAQGRKTNQEA